AEVDGDTEMANAGENVDESVIHLNVVGRAATVPVHHDQQTPASKATSCTSSSHGQATNKTSDKPTEPLSPPISTDSHGHPVPTTHAHVDEDPTDVFANGGVPWYLEPFDPEGTTVHDERYTGRAVLRDMSEELSDMDEDTLTELAVNGVEATPNGKETPAKGDPVQPPETTQQQKKKTPARKKARKLEAQSAAQNAKPKEWNPYTIFILLAIVVGSNAINTLALRNEMLNYNRKTDAKLELLREVVQRVKDGEDVDVKKMLGTGDAQAEKEWEEVMRDLESTDALAEGQKRREAKRAAKAEERKAQEKEKLAAKGRDAAVNDGSTTTEATKERRPKFMM
ncbi:hypothetical protein KC343_g8841, partial [Hortaea werneckii]